MLFIVEEDIMNGTFKQDSIISAIEANDFNEAKQILKKADNFIYDSVSESENEMFWKYAGSVASIYGRMRNNELNIINKKE